ncbi:MAG: CRISPR-associated endonuclease Cas1 [Methanobacteriaceae archaeon]|jgi:CRISPR-associated protein Cas1|nr:CRISPR-associated endonuclease Cas1 [Candidatus Methanorudis spinitermitis]
MKLVVDGFGKSIAKRDNQIVIKENGKEKDFFLAKDLSQILILGKGSITFDAMKLLAEENVDCLAINWKGNVDYRLSPSEMKNVNIKKEQYFALKDNRSGYLAKSFIKAKIENQKATLGTLAKSRDDDYLRSQRDKISIFSSKIDLVAILPIDNIKGTIFGIEGQASIEYWNGIKHVLNGEFGFVSRSGRYAKDPVNSMLNYGYAILQGEIWRALHLAGLDPYCGFLHSDRYGRTSLVFDLMEEFRQQIVDKSVLSLLNKNQVKKADFEFNKGSIIILEKARHLLASSILDKLSSKIAFNEKNTKYSSIINYQAKLIAKFLENKDMYTGFYLRW